MVDERRIQRKWIPSKPVCFTLVCFLRYSLTLVWSEAFLLSVIRLLSLFRLYFFISLFFLLLLLSSLFRISLSRLSTRETVLSILFFLFIHLYLRVQPFTTCLGPYAPFSTFSVYPPSSTTTMTTTTTRFTETRSYVGARNEDYGSFLWQGKVVGVMLKASYPILPFSFLLRPPFGCRDRERKGEPGWNPTASFNYTNPLFPLDFTSSCQMQHAH